LTKVPPKTKKHEKSDSEKFIDYLEDLLTRMIENEKSREAEHSDYARGLAKGDLIANEFILKQIQEFREGEHFCQRG
jgi:hypothetical protein